MNCFAFDIETIPDVELGRKLLDLDGSLSDQEVGNAMLFRQQQKTGNEFLPLHQHRVVAISVAMRTAEGLKVWSLGDRDAAEKEIVQRFFDGIGKYTPDLVSWNGSGFDLPVLHYRALRHGVQAAQYWETGDEVQSFRWNNYVNRYHWRHLDLMDVLSGFQPRARAGLDQVAVMLGYPGKFGMHGGDVWDTWLDGGIDEIRQYCETDVVNTYLVYLSFEHMRGRLDAEQLGQEQARVRDYLSASGLPHMLAFNAAWTGG